MSGYGVCNDEDCDWQDPLGEQCSECGVGVFAPVPLDSLCSNAAEVVLNVVLPTFVVEDVVASRTRASD